MSKIKDTAMPPATIFAHALAGTLLGAGNCCTA